MLSSEFCNFMSRRTLQHTGHPHPVLVLANLGKSCLITHGFLQSELEARLLPAMPSSLAGLVTIVKDALPSHSCGFVSIRG